ncbi:MAG: 4-(cytidine 5'-diphospho)-2-C-methyl-D-erythritol kinase [Opitutales bacterium]
MNFISQVDQGGWWRIDCPAKVNLMLSVHGKRPDGFHELTSLMAPLQFGDHLELRECADGPDSLECSDALVPTDTGNLILQAAEAFRRASGLSAPFAFRLKKAIPVGAGLGGGSSDGAATLLALNEWHGRPLSRASLAAMAAELGSDCPFFLDRRPALVGGRGDRIEALPPAIESRLVGQKLLLCHPPFSVETAWAYRRLADSGKHYEPASEARERLDAFFAGGQLGDLLFNSFEQPVGDKYLAIPGLLDVLRGAGASCLMSGSGSACFILLGEGADAGRLTELCRSCWGEGAFCVETSVIGVEDQLC